MKRKLAYRAPYQALYRPVPRRSVRSRRGPARSSLRGRRAGYLRRGGYYGRYTPAGAEQKFHDLDIDDAAISSAGAILANGSCNLIAQGVTESERIGRKCTITAINWRFEMTLPEADAVATPGPSGQIRVIVFLDKQANGATAVVTDILETADYQSFNNLANTSRFRTLMDRSYSLNRQSLASDGAGVVSEAEYAVHDTFYKKVKIPIEFSGATGALTEIRSNNIGVLVIGRTSLPKFESKMRIRFSDS